MTNQFKKMALCFLLASTSLIQSANIFFDLNGVLIKTSKKAFVSNIGFSNMLSFLFKFNNPFSVFNRTFEILHKIEAKNENTYGATDGKGHILPNIMCDWMLGRKTEEIRAQITDFIDENHDFFHNTSEETIIRKVTTSIFTPEIMASATKINKKAYKLAKKCFKEDHNLFVLSNWDGESFDLLYEKHEKLFRFFEKEQIIISGQIGLMKPDPAIYAYVLETFELNPAECIFLDDQQENIDAAKEMGIRSILYKNSDIDNIKDELEELIDEIGYST